MSNKGSIYLIPNGLGNESFDEYIPNGIGDILEKLDFCFVEHPKLARKLIVGMGKKHVLDKLELISFKQGLPRDLRILISDSLKAGKNIGILSDAGLPAVADPGNNIVRIAHSVGSRVVPCSGPSSIMMALMASGFNGQRFTFHGYLPKDPKGRQKRLRIIEKNLYEFDQTQIFIETPYRNNHLFKDMLSQSQKNTKICLAVNLTMEDEFIAVKEVSDWNKNKPDLHKKHCVFLMYK